MTNTLFKAGVILLAIPALAVPAASLAYILWQGVPALLYGTADGFGTDADLLPQLIGSLSLAGGACLLAAPVATGAALYYRLRAGPRRQAVLRGLLQLLQGIPGIVYGLCGLMVLVYMLDWGVSLLAGAVVLAVLVLPLLVLNTIAALARIPAEKTEAARALGLTEGETVARLWLPQLAPAVVTGVLLGSARALAETAPILFTAAVFSGVRWPDSLFSPVTTLQTHIFYLAQEGANPQAVAMAWGSGTVLVALVLTFSLTAHWLRKRFAL